MGDMVADVVVVNFVICVEATVAGVVVFIILVVVSVSVLVSVSFADVFMVNVAAGDV